MNKKLFLTFAGLAMSVTLLSGCNPIHFHNITVPFESNEESHWKTCTACGEKFMVGEHVINDLTNKCLVCDYIDPVVIVDEQGTMIGLTKHGKTKNIIDLPSTVKYVAKDALADSKVILLNLSRDFEGYYEGAFDKENLIVKPAEEEVTWEFLDGIYYKHDILTEYDARIDGVLYTTLNEAFEAVDSEETTITILKDNLVVEHQIVVNHTVTLEAYHSHIKLDCDFSIYSGCTLYVPSSITLTSDVRLMLADTKEEISDHFDNVYSSGSIAFTNTETKPENVDVRYVKDFDIDIELGYKAVGSKQVANSLIVALPVTHYAYGTFVFSKDFKEVKGLTAYGKTVSDLYITNIVEDIDAIIPYHAFAIYTDIKINIDKIKDTHITLNQTKGMFLSLHICDGITSIGQSAFTNETTDDLFHEVKIQIALLISHIMSVEIGDSVKTIGDYAFNGQLSIEEVRGGRGLTSIGRQAFYENASLRIVDFSEAYNLTKINPRAFYYCDTLTSVFIPRAGWKVQTTNTVGGLPIFSASNTYLPFQFDPEFVAHLLVHCNDIPWERTSVGHIAYTGSTNKDNYGRYCKVSFTDDLMTAINGCADCGWVWLLEGTPENQRHIDLKNVSKVFSIFADPSLDNVTLGDKDTDLVINSNVFLTLSNVKVLSKSVLLKNSSSTEDVITKTGGIAIRTDDSEEVPNLNVKYDCSNAEKSVATCTKANLILNEYYNAYGLFDFENKDSTQIIKNVARLGSVANEVEIKEQYDISSSKVDLKLEIADSAFKDNTALRYVNISKRIQYIRANAFNGCTNLKEVKIGYGSTLMIINLKEIGQRAFFKCTSLRFFGINDLNINFMNKICSDAFGGCTALEEADLGTAKYSDWVVGSSGTISHESLMDTKLAAKLLAGLGFADWTKKPSED